MAKRRQPQPTPNEYREKIKELRKRGIVRKDYDLRKIVTGPRGKITGPMSGGRTVQELVSEFDDVLSGKAEVYRASEVEPATRKKLFKKIFTSPKTGEKARFVFVPKFANEKVSVTKDGHIERYNIDAGIRRIEVPVEYRNLEQFLTEANLKKYKLDKGFKRFGFRYRGGYSNTFRTAQQAFDEILSGDSTPMANTFGASPWEQRQEYAMFEFVEIADTREWERQREKAKADRLKEKRAAAKKRRKK